MAEPAEPGDERCRDGLVGEVPDHGAQLGFGVEAQAVVDRPDPAVAVDQDVAALAVGGVGHDVERAEVPEGVVRGGVLEDREVVLGEVGVDEVLPNEQGLCGLLNVSRTVLREGIKSRSAGDTP